jgi:hypothetical protein
LILDQLQKTQVQTKYICAGTQRIPIEWNKFTELTDEHNLAASKEYVHWTTIRKPSIFVVHWSDTLTAKSCYDVLEKRGLSVHFIIDNDGQIYQSVNTNESAYHAGEVNKFSIGVEVSCATELKYQQYYKSKCGLERPIWDSIVHGKRCKVLGFYPVQIEALEVLLKSVCTFYNIPFQVPTDQKGNLIKTVYSDILTQKFSGICGHYNLTVQKEDPSGLDFLSLVKKLNS